MNDRRAYAILLLVILFWAGNYPVGKLGVGDLGPLTLTGGRALLAGPLLLVLARLTAPLTRPLSRTDYMAFAVLGGTGLVTNTTLWYWGLKYTSALNAGILGAAAPIFVSVASALLFGDRLSVRNWLGIALTVLAVVLTLAKGSLGVLLTLSINHGDLIILASQVAWITYSLYSRAAASTLPPVWVMAGANLAAGLVLVPLAAVVERPWQSWWAWRGWVVVVYGALPVTLGHLWFYEIVRAIGAGRAVTFLNLMPFVVLAMAWLLVGEQIHVYHVVGALLVAAGVYLVTRRT
jgi:drug/metabolite transporter (DMT)-like permease